MKMNKRRTLILVLLISVVFIPLTVIFTPKVAASWLKEGEVFSMTGFDDQIRVLLLTIKAFYITHILK